MAGITNGYCTLEEFKRSKDITSTDAKRDSVIERIIEGASRDFDTETGRTFYARTETRYYSIPDGRELSVDDDLLTITTLTNGDANTIASTEYNLLPRNISPKFSVKLKGSSSYYWDYDSSGNSEYVISILGTWGYSATTPSDVRQAVLMIAEMEYDSRFGTSGGAVTVTGAGVVITPQSWPAKAKMTARKYKRMV